MTAQQKVINLAYAQLGYVETATNKTKYAADLDAMGDIYNGPKNGYDWCDVFVDWLFITAFGKTVGMKLLTQPYKGTGAGVGYSAQFYKAKGQFKASPAVGDQIFFNNGNSWTHTGIVVAVKNGMVYTIEGNAGNNADRVVECRYPVGASYIGGYGRPDWSLVPADTPEISKTIDQLAQEVIAGKWGTGTDRKNALTAAGYDYNAVQNRVNQMLSGSTPSKSIDEVAREVIQGKWGNGSERRQKLEAAGYDADAVQNRVNQLL